MEVLDWVRQLYGQKSKTPYPPLPAHQSRFLKIIVRAYQISPLKLKALLKILTRPAKKSPQSFEPRLR